ncbi:unnamed protein product [Sphagnum balticum]
MGSSNNEAGDEDRISDGVRSDADVVLVNLADAGSTALAHKRKRARGEFSLGARPWMDRGRSLSTEGEADKASSAPGSNVLVQTMLKSVSFPDHVTHKYENAVVDFVIGRNISL